MSLPADIRFAQPDSIPLRFQFGWGGVLFLLLIPAILLFSMEKFLFGGVAVAGVVALMLITQPRIAFWVFLASLSFHYVVYIPPVGISPYDVGALLFLGAMIVEFWLRGDKLEPTGLDLPFMLFISAAWLSCAFAFAPSRGIVSSGKLLLIYLIYRALVQFAPKLGLRKLLMSYFWFVVILSIGNMILFVLGGGGKRAFGTASVSYETFAMTGFAMAVWFVIRATNTTERMIYLLSTIAIIGGTIASQSRGPLISFALTVPFVLIVASGQGKREGRKSFLRGVLLTGVAIGLMVGVIALFQGELFKTYLGRLQQIPNSIINPEGTILLRLVLWKVSWLAFLEHPITGIGLGNFSVIEDFVLAAKAHPLWYYVHGATAHNVIMHYLAETGILGVSALLFLSWRGISFARTAMRRAGDQSDATTYGAIYALVFVFFSTLFFMRAWTWEQGAYVFALIFALTAIAYANSKKIASQPRDN